MFRIFLLVCFSVLVAACDVGVNETAKKISHDKTAAAAVEIARQNGCLNCHNVTGSIVGPGWDLVSERYKDSEGAREYLIEKVKNGGDGNWNNITGGAKMPSHRSRVSHEHIVQIVDFILSLKR